MIKHGDDPFRGKVAVVTGGGRGLGFAIAAGFAERGAAVVLLELDPETGKAAVERLKHASGPIRSIQTDVSVSAQMSSAFRAIEDEFTRVDFLINNAGVFPQTRPDVRPGGAHTYELSDEDWHLSLGVMQSGVFYGMREAGKIMLPQGSGAIVNMSSIRGFSSLPGRMPYGPMKAATIMMTKIAAAEYGPHGVRVNAVAPGFTRTEAHESDVAAGTADDAALIDAIPLRRLGTPRDIANLTIFLCSDEASWITGECITIDGGMTTIAAG